MEFETLHTERDLTNGAGYLGGARQYSKIFIRRRAVPFKVISDLHSPFLQGKEIFTKIVIKRLDNASNACQNTDQRQLENLEVKK